MEKPLEIILLNDGSVEVPDKEAYEEWSQRTGKQVVTCVSDAGIDPVKALLDEMTDDQRLALFGQYCVFCGSKDSPIPCTCMRDD